MPLSFSIEPAALAELRAATEFHEAQRPNLGDKLVEAVDAALLKLSDFPDAWPRDDDGVRRCPVAGFPYWLVYVRTAEQVSIVAIVHSSREPGYWRERLDNR